MQVVKQKTQEMFKYIFYLKIEEYCMKKYISKEKINFNNVITELKFPQDFNFLERLEMQ